MDVPCESEASSHLRAQLGRRINFGAKNGAQSRGRRCEEVPRYLPIDVVDSKKIPKKVLRVGGRRPRSWHASVLRVHSECSKDDVLDMQRRV